MTTVLATYDDVAATYELPMPTDAATRARVETLIRQATARLVALVPSISARIAAGTLDPDLPGGMVIEAVLRVFRNPAGATEQTAGPFSRRFAPLAAKNEIFFDPEQVQALLPGNDVLGIGTVKLGIPARSRRPMTLDSDGRYIYTSEQLQGYLYDYTDPTYSGPL